MTTATELLKEARDFISQVYPDPATSSMRYPSELVLRIDAHLANPPESVVGTEWVPVADAWMRRDGAIWEVNQREVCQEQLGLKPVVLYVNMDHARFGKKEKT